MVITLSLNQVWESLLINNELRNRLKYSAGEVVGFYWTDTGSVIVNPERDGSVAISL